MNDTDPRCDRCGDKITPDGREWRCVGCDIYCNARGRKLPRQPNAAERMRRMRERPLILDLGEAFGPITYQRQKQRPPR